MKCLSHYFQEFNLPCAACAYVKEIKTGEYIMFQHSAMIAPNKAHVLEIDLKNERLRILNTETQKKRWVSFEYVIIPSDT